MENYVGKRLDGRYEIQEIIGVGGMAVVYKAYDNIDDRTVAVKILKEEFLANEEFRRRFKTNQRPLPCSRIQTLLRFTMSATATEFNISSWNALTESLSRNTFSSRA